MVEGDLLYDEDELEFYALQKETQQLGLLAGVGAAQVSSADSLVMHAYDPKSVMHY